MIALLSPAKKIETKKGPKASTTKPQFFKQADLLAQKMKKKSAQEIGSLMNISAQLSDLNYERYQCWDSDFTAQSEAHPAAYMFAGDVYRGLEAESIDAKNQNYFQDHIFILSGLYGLLRPFDAILPYRLEMGTKWAVDSNTKNLYEFWSDQLQKHIEDQLEKANTDTVINLASNEYYKAVSGLNKEAKVITPVFKDLKNGDYKTIMVYAKKARGMMARFMVDKAVKSAESLKAFDTEGYYFSPQNSSEEKWVFLRDN